MLHLIIVGASALRQPAVPVSRRAVVTSTLGLATALPVSANNAGGAAIAGGTPEERGELTGTDIEAACREYFVPDYFKSIESGKISSKDYLPGATVVDGRDAVGPGRKPAVANGADAAATQFMALSTKGATAQIVSLQSEAGAAYKADPAATVNYLVTLPDGSTRYRGTARVVKPNGQTKWFIDTDVFPLDNPKVNYMVVPTRDWRGVVTMALDKKFRKK